MGLRSIPGYANQEIHFKDRKSVKLSPVNMEAW